MAVDRKFVHMVYYSSRFGDTPAFETVYSEGGVWVCGRVCVRDKTRLVFQICAVRILDFLDLSQTQISELVTSN